MEIPYLLAWKIQLVIDSILIILCIYILYLVISLILKVRKGKDIDKKRYIKKILIYSLILIGIFLITNIFFQYDPLNIIENPLFLDSIKPL